MNVRPYYAIARTDHWFKNVFMLLGVGLAFFVDPEAPDQGWYWKLLYGGVATCLVASSNYVLNEILDAPLDRLHPRKKERPIPAGLVYLPVAWAEWVLLAAAGFALAALVNLAFLLTALTFWVAGIFYNVQPMRTKDVPYLDVLTESINNPIRLFLGWFVLRSHEIPPLSLIISYWMVGAFFMGTKRLGEYRQIGARIAAQYRLSFRHYTEERILLSLVFYATACSFFLGVFVIHYQLELILGAPLFMGFFVFYLHVGLSKDSVVQNPEKLYRQPGFMAYLVLCFVVFFGLLYVRIPQLYDIFKVAGNTAPPLWSF